MSFCCHYITLILGYVTSGGEPVYCIVLYGITVTSRHRSSASVLMSVQSIVSWYIFMYVDIIKCVTLIGQISLVFGKATHSTHPVICNMCLYSMNTHTLSNMYRESAECAALKTDVFVSYFHNGLLALIFVRWYTSAVLFAVLITTCLSIFVRLPLYFVPSVVYSHLGIHTITNYCHACVYVFVCVCESNAR
jgi:hypothetical protein